MVAGTNLAIDVWRISYRNDDAIGGAVVSGSIQFHNISARFEYQPYTKVIMEQGIEANKLVRAVVVPGTLDIRERDEVEIIAPFDHWDIHKRFRVMGIERGSHTPRDPRNYLILHLTRSERAHTRV